MDAWLKELAPSSDSRKWFGHQAARWEAFRKRYREELAGEERLPMLADLVARARSGTVTLVYGARDREHNNAEVIRELIEERLRSRT